MRRTELDLMLAGLVGAGGVADAALAQHVTGGGPLASAAEIMMIHAAAIVGLVAFRRGDATAPSAVGKIALAMGLGAAIFGIDVTLLAFTGAHLFPMAAPIGGGVLILSWLALAVLVIVERVKHGEPPT
ncbi:MAG: DUF423 domain-containing protein [Phyllobacteriaceae bacterium]|nr:DUF423 domain-containing protein [Phyllobacteriaceae bacterium]